MERSDIPDDLKERERIIFGNLSDILTFHKGTFIQELQKCENQPELLPTVFLQSVSVNCLPYYYYSN